MQSGTVGTILTATVLALGVAGVSGCERQISGPSIVLRLATPDKQTDPTGAAVEHFADQVAERSGGSIRIEPVWDVTPDGSVGWDQTVAKGVADGTWDMGLVPGRAWDVLGVDSLRPLNAPFLITNQAALRAVLDSRLREDLLSGLPEAGVTGVDMFPDGLRHPFGYDEPLLDARDYAGRTIWAARSDTVARVFDALGATTDDSSNRQGERGAEAQYELTPGQVATGNVTFFPKTNTLVLRTSVREHLRDDQWSLLRAAAAATRHWLYAEQPSDQEAADTFCAQGGSIASATPQQVAGLKTAVQPAVRWLRRDADTRRLMDAIEDEVDGVAGDPPVACPDEPPPTGEEAELASLDGTYVTRISQKQLRGAGVVDVHQVLENSGRFTFVLDAGTWNFHQTANQFIGNPDDSGAYTYRDGVFTIHWDTAGDQTSARLKVAGDGTIHFLDIRDARPENQALSEGYFASAWTRVGGVPD
jgi:Bacterial extracellular solute-binding protein, family 7